MPVSDGHILAYGISDVTPRSFYPSGIEGITFVGAGLFGITSLQAVQPGESCTNPAPIDVIEFGNLTVSDTTAFLPITSWSSGLFILCHRFLSVLFSSRALIIRVSRPSMFTDVASLPLSLNSTTPTVFTVIGSVSFSPQRIPRSMKATMLYVSGFGFSSIFASATRACSH